VKKEKISENEFSLRDYFEVSGEKTSEDAKLVKDK
jgi:hypothetical protein